MPNSNGRIYRTSTYGVSVYDVQQVLGNTSNDVGTLCSYYGLGAASTGYAPYGINKWATFKPVVLENGVSPLTMANIVTDTKFGLTVLNNTVNGGLNIGTAMMILCGDAQGAFMRPYMYDLVAYTPPSGTTSSPYRLSDFAYANNVNVGYYHRASLRYSYQDSNNEWHGIAMRYGAGTEREVSVSSTEVDDLNAEVDWTNFSDASLLSITDSNLTTLQNSILIHDLFSSYRSYNKGIAFMNSYSDGEIIVFVGSLDWSNQTLRSIIADTSITTVTFEFLTNASAGVYTYGEFESFNWVAIPGCGGMVSATSGEASYAIIAVIGGNGYIMNPGTVNWYFDISAVIKQIDFDVVGMTSGSRKYVQLVLGESEDSTASGYGNAVNVYGDTYTIGTEIAYPLADESAKGLTLYLNIVGKVSSTTTGVLWSEEITLGDD